MRTSNSKKSLITRRNGLNQHIGYCWELSASPVLCCALLSLLLVYLHSPRARISISPTKALVRRTSWAARSSNVTDAQKTRGVKDSPLREVDMMDFEHDFDTDMVRRLCVFKWVVFTLPARTGHGPIQACKFFVSVP